MSIRKRVEQLETKRDQFGDGDFPLLIVLDESGRTPEGKTETEALAGLLHRHGDNRTLLIVRNA